jgi:hypothetical protein
LRKGDELRAFFETFTQMVGGLRAIEKRQLAEIEGALAALDAGSKDEAVVALRRLREAIASALEG